MSPDKDRGGPGNAKEQSVAAICHVSLERARELLAAVNSSVERAVDLHLSSSDKPTSQLCAKSPKNKTVRLSKPEAQSSPPAKKQQRLDGFFTPTKSAPDSRPKPETVSLLDTDDDETIIDAKPTAAAVSGKTQELKPAPEHHKKGNSSQQAGTCIPYMMFASAFDKMASTQKRNTKIECLCDLYKHVIDAVGGVGKFHSENDEKLLLGARLLTIALELTLGKLLALDSTSSIASVPPLNCSWGAISKALGVVTGATRQLMRDKYRSSGDVGDVAAELFPTKTAKSFFVKEKTESKGCSISDVHDALWAVATVESGAGSQAVRHRLLVDLMRKLSNKEELRFIVRALLGNMRIGATLKSVLTALALAASNASIELDPKERLKLADRLQKVYNVCPSLFSISRALLEGGIQHAEKVCTIQLGYAIEPMLANAAQSMDEVKSFLGEDEALLEWKYDGVRCQAHFSTEQGVTLFSRHLLDSTKQYPAAVASLRDARKSNVHSFIVDAEIVAISEDGGGLKLLPFQELTRRSTVDGSSLFQVCVYAFDLLFLNGTSLLETPFPSRRKMLQDNFSLSPGFVLAQSTTLQVFDEDAVLKTLREATSIGAEGLMIKRLTSSGSLGYEAGSRSHQWLKLKKDYLGGFTDTIDVVPIGAWFGTGRKAERGYLSPVLLAVYNEDNGVYESVSRCMSFSDKMYACMKDYYFRGIPYPDDIGLDNEQKDADSDGTKRLEDVPEEERVYCSLEKPSDVVTNETPSVWFQPREVWEVAFADLSLSQVHTAGHESTENGRGVALRFPRFKRRRLDKSVEQTTTSMQLVEIYAKQAKVAS